MNNLFPKKIFLLALLLSGSLLFAGLKTVDAAGDFFEATMQESKAEVHIKTYIDGQLVEDISEISASTGQAAIEIKNVIHADGKKAESDASVMINGKISTSSKTVILNSSIGKPEIGKDSEKKYLVDNATAPVGQAETQASAAPSHGADIITLLIRLLSNLKNFFNNFLT